VRELYSSPFFVLRVDDDRRVVTRARTERGFATIEEAEGEYGTMLRAFDQVSRARFGLLVDMRPAPPRNDPAFEKLLGGLYARLYGGFREVAVIVKTQAGRLQVTRLLETRGIKATIFTDEAAAIAHLGLEHITGERVRASAIPAPAASDPARRVGRRGG
jgi:hypothetical protein